MEIQNDEDLSGFTISPLRNQLFRTMRSRVHEVVVVRRTINLGCWEFGMGRERGGVKKGEVSLRVT